MTRIRVEEGDLTRLEVDAIVNAANTQLLLGSGVAGAIREGGGPEIQRECDAHGPVPLGGAVLTTAGDLPARCVIHAAGMEPGRAATEQSLRDCTRETLELARRRGLRSIAFPAIGTGVGGFSMQRCAEIMLEAAEQHAADPTPLEEIRFVLYGEPAYRVFEHVLDASRVLAQMEKLAK